MQHVRFDKSTLKRCRFSQRNMIYDSFWNGCRILKCRYEQIQLAHNVIKGTDFAATHFIDVKFWSTEFVGGFRKCQFTNVKWGGSKPLGVRFIGGILENVDFAGANLKNCQFVKCKFHNTNFEKMKSVNTDFIDCVEM